MLPIVGEKDGLYSVHRERESKKDTQRTSIDHKYRPQHRHAFLRIASGTIEQSS